MDRKVLFDTDIGSDIDDAVCLAYLLVQPKCELLGITTVTGEPERRAMLASALCRVAGRQVPIYPGVASPLLVPQKQTEAQQACALERWDHQTEFPVGQAVEFMRQTIRAHPGQVTLLAVGPLTNVGLLFAVDPQIPSLLRELVLMCGVFTTQLAGVGPLEWNAIGDPHATAIVYRGAAAVHRSIGLEVTCRVRMPAAQVRQAFRAPLLHPVLDFAEVWFQRTDQVTFHDPLAAVTLFDEGVCAFARGQVEVELASERVRGMTHWRAAPEGPHQVALRVEPERFFAHYFATLDRAR
ncbi:MAG: nucleoside hydrolase [Candidatus Latescibacterota bacterium]